MVILQLRRLLTRSFALFFHQCEDGIVQDLTESIVVELAHGHLLILFLLLQVLEHLLEHRLLVARAHSLLESTFLLNLRFLLIRVEVNLILEVFSSI